MVNVYMNVSDRNNECDTLLSLDQQSILLVVHVVGLNRSCNLRFEKTCLNPVLKNDVILR